jgi:hypothetical protein
MKKCFLQMAPETVECKIGDKSKEASDEISLPINPSATGKANLA